MRINFLLLCIFQPAGLGALKPVTVPPIRIKLSCDAKTGKYSSIANLYPIKEEIGRLQRVTQKEELKQRWPRYPVSIVQG